ncbi:hypothetical protein ACHAXA_009033 [Cyclostephanos tholiformis]|uniref:MOSC domain-containing protein n=1 Tax=Cyclostephanos tholiformis TaxID=382380 RepID=A0ABD3RY63_9STRA
MMPLSSMGDLRRNLVIRGIGANEMNDTVGREVVHRRTVPCKKSEAQCERPGLVNNLWDDCGVNCEVLTHGTIRVGDTVRMLTTTGYDDRRLRRADPSHKPPAFFVRPSDRTAEQARGMIIPPRVAACMCLIDPEGFVRVERGYNSVGQRFWSTRAYRAGMFARALRAPLMIAILAILVAVVLQVKIIWIR